MNVRVSETELQTNVKILFCRKKKNVKESRPVFRNLKQ